MRLAIIGGGGHGRVVAEAAELMECWREIAFFDDRYTGEPSSGSWTVHGRVVDLFERAKAWSHCLVAVGDNRVRLRLQQDALDAGLEPTLVVHPRACVSRHASIGIGSAVLGGAVINIGTCIGRCAIINTSCSIDHDCQLGEGVHVSPNASLAGGVSVGDRSWIGMGSAIRQNIRVGKDVIVGAGSVVLRDVDDGITVLGNPARPNPERSPISC